MAFKFTQKYKKQKYLLGALFLVIIITGLVWWRGFYSSSGETREFSSSYPGKEISINFGVLENEIFDEMKLFPKISMPEEVGKENPFFQTPPVAEQPLVEEEEEEEEE